MLISSYCTMNELDRKRLVVTLTLVQNVECFLHIWSVVSNVFNSLTSNSVMDLPPYPVTSTYASGRISGDLGESRAELDGPTVTENFG